MPPVSGRSIAIVLRLIWAANNKKDWENFCYKDQDEFMGPLETTCPERILKLLTPLDPADPHNKHAIQWREACWARIKKAKERVRFKVGDFLEFDRPFNFSNGESARTFKVLKLKPRLILTALPSTGASFTARFSWNQIKAAPYKLVGDPSATPAPAPAPTFPPAPKFIHTAAKQLSLF